MKYRDPALAPSLPVFNPPKLALTPSEAAAMISMSRDSFDKYVKPELRLVRRGRLVLVPVAELEKWLDRSAAMTLDAR